MRKEVFFPVIIFMTAGITACSLFKSQPEAATNAAVDTEVVEVPIKERSPGEPDTTGPIFDIVEENPRFPGGEEARIAYMVENVTYPEEALKKKIEGVVYVSFVVERDGSISNVKVLRGIGGDCDKEAVRVVQNMPRWEPGKHRGKPVRVRFTMPIRFMISG